MKIKLVLKVHCQFNHVWARIHMVEAPAPTSCSLASKSIMANIWPTKHKKNYRSWAAPILHGLSVIFSGVLGNKLKVSWIVWKCVITELWNPTVGVNPPTPFLDFFETDYDLAWNSLNRPIWPLKFTLSQPFQPPQCWNYRHELSNLEVFHISI